MGIRGSKFRDETLEKYKKIIGQEATSWGYGEYIRFLREEIDKKQWNNNKYNTFLLEKGWNGVTSKFNVDKICAWEKVQQDIFQAVMDSYSTTAFTWEEQAKGLLTDARKTHFSNQTCDNFNDPLKKKIEIIQDLEKDNCNLNTVDNLCIPVRRSKFQFETLSENIKEIKSSKGGTSELRSNVALTTVIGTLAAKINEDILSLKFKYPDNKDLCKLLRRTYADYKDIIENKDIIDNKTSKGLQCLLNELKDQLRGGNSALSLLIKHFKIPVEKKLHDSNVNSGDNNLTPCHLDDTDYAQKPQCLRFLEEWFEEFWEKKKEYEERIKETCVEVKTRDMTLIDGSKLTIPCSEYCKEYQNLLNKLKICYVNYISKCKENLKSDKTYKDERLYNTEVERIQRITKKKYDCNDNDCGKDGSVHLEAFFDPKKRSVNKIYCCGCIDSVSDIIKVFGENDKESSYIEAILNKLSICTPIDNHLNGAKKDKIMSKGKFTDICSINYGNSNLAGTGTCSGVPCNDYYKNVKQWICDFKKGTSDARLKTGWSDGTGTACLPPRTQRLCLGRIYSNSCTNPNIENIDTNEKLLNELIIAARFEGTQLYNKYITTDTYNSRSIHEKRKRLCNAAKYSFADLGDIVKGTSIWENNDTRTMENNLKIIFKKIYNILDYRIQEKYKDDAKIPQFLKLREVWWNTNRQYIWKALVCGMNSLDRNNPIACISADQPTNIDYMPQFLRWLTEWTSEFCEERTKMLNDLGKKCELCKNVTTGGHCVGGKCESNECQPECKKYKMWIQKKYGIFLKQEKKFDNVMKNKKDKIYKQFVKDDKISSFLSDQLKGTCNNIYIFDNNGAFKDVPHDCNCNTSLGSVDPNGNKCINPTSPDVCNEINSRIIRDNLSNEKCSGIILSSDIKWKNNNTPDGDKAEGRFNKSYKHIPQGVEVSPRRQNLCIAKLNAMVNDETKRTEEELKQALLVDVANESYNISKYLKSGINAQYKVEANNALKYSFFDYKNIIEGTDLIENNNNDGINNMLNKIIGKNGNPTGERNSWWNKNKDCVRQAMLCGYQEGNEIKNVPDQNLLPIDDDDTEQFLYWIQEWYEDFCKKRKEISENVEKACKDNENNFNCNKCIDECNKYKEFLDIKKGEWIDQQKYYNKNHKNAQNSKLLQEYLNIHCPNFDGCETRKSKFNLDNLFTNTYGNNESLCGCEKYNDRVYVKHSNKDNCKGLLRFNETKWKDKQTKDANVTHFEKLPENMYVSARRQGLCIKGIDSIDIKGKPMDEKKEILRKHLLDVAAVEGYNIGKYYKEKKEKKNDANSSKYSYSVKECNALKYSFYDFKNIVIGKDYLELREDERTNPTDTEKSFIVAFSSRDTPNDDDRKDMTKNRIDFWHKHKKCFWNAMLCGYKKGSEKPNFPDGCDPYDLATDENLPQFLLWLNEWMEDFCEQRQKKIEEMKNDCVSCKSEMKGQNDISICEKANCMKCKSKCEEYKTWKKNWKQNWDKLKNYYSNEKDNVDGPLKNYVNGKEMEDFINNTFKYKCQYDKIFKIHEHLDTPHEFNTECDCTNKIKLRTKDQNTPSIGNSDVCDGVITGEWDIWDCKKIDEKNICIQKGSNYRDSQYNDKFGGLFDEWLNFFFEEHKEVTENLKNCTKAVTNVCPDGCQNKCLCYKKWVNKKIQEWKKQKKNYQEYYNRTKATSTYGSGGRGKDLKTYLYSKHRQKLKNALGGQHSVAQAEEEEENDPNYDAINKILGKEIENSNKCIKNCPVPISCEEKGFQTQWECNKTINASSSGGGTVNMCIRKKDDITKLDYEKDFFNYFMDWFEDSEKQINENLEAADHTCAKTQNKINGTCGECTKNCSCFTELIDKKIKEWEEQQKHYNQYNEKQKKQKSIDSVSLSDFLYAKCYNSLTEGNEHILPINLEEIEEKCGDIEDNRSAQRYTKKLKELQIRGDKTCKGCMDKQSDPTSSQDVCVKDDSSIKGTCNEKVYDGKINDKSKIPKEWKPSINKENQNEDKIIVPPRRQQLCISYFKDNNIDSEDDLKKYLKLSIKNETKELLTYYKTPNPVTGNSNGTKNDENNLPAGFCKAVERSFADLGDFVKGTDLDYSVGDTTAVKNRLKTSFSGKSENYGKIWWENNKRDLWKSVKCGIEEANKLKGSSGASTSLNCPQNLDFDRRDQFLRWFEEWGEYLCIEHTKELKKLLDECKYCNNGLNCGANSGPISGGNGCNSGKCTTACGNYKSWINKRKKQWNKLSAKYKEKQTQYEDDDETFWAKHMPASTYLKFFNTDTCSKTFFNKLFYEDFDYGDQQSLCECDKTKHKMENLDETDVPAPDDITSNPCKVHNQISTCHQKNFDGVLWTTRNIRTDKNGQRMLGVYAPPRRQKLCVGNIWLHATNTTTLLNELLLVAKKEGEFLKKYYESQQSGGKVSSGNNNEFCKALKRSFYDLGDIVKGTDLRRGAIVTATEKRVHEIFKKELNNGGKPPNEDKIEKEREKWWEDNKENVWKAMTCDNTCDSNKTPSYITPQFLRWYEEWFEEFSKRRQQLLDNIIDKCSKKNAEDKCDDDKDCQEACTRYGDWLKPKGNEWREQKTKYAKDHENAIKYYENEEFLTSTKGHATAIEYLKDICKEKKDWECDKTKAENMDQIVRKIDKEYKEMYEPLCTRCRMKQIKETIQKIKDKKYTTTVQNPESRLIVENICDYNKNVDITKANNKEVITIPIEPDNNDTKKNNEKGTMNCGGIPSKESDYIWKNKDRTNYYWVRNLDNRIQIPPRRQKLCSHGLDKSNNVHDLKKQLLTVAANDAYNLGIKYNDYKNHYGVKPCRALQYSFNDYKHLIKGGELLENEDSDTNKAIERSVKSITLSNKSQINDNKEKRRTFWEQKKDCLWKIMKRGYEKGKQKGGNSSPDINDDCKIPEDTKNTDQFLSWLQEWYEDYCNIRNKLKSDVENTCNIEKETFDCKKCDEKCQKYKEYMEKKKIQWESQDKYYTLQKSNGPAKGYTEQNATEYLQKKFTSSCDSNSGTSQSGDEVKTNIEFFDKSSYYGLDEPCTCYKYNNEEIYGDIVGQDNCKGLHSDAQVKKIKWENKGTGYSYLPELTEEVYFPPRRQRMCIHGIDTLQDNTNENQLRTELIKRFAAEGKHLGQYYKEKNNNNGNDKYSYDIESWNAMKYSFLDYRNIILGYDNLENDGSNTGGKLTTIFKNLASNKSAYGNKTADEVRKKIWEENNDCFWEAMKCGYKKGYGDHKIPNGFDSIPSDKDYPIGNDRKEGTAYQFLRWFTEWGEDFCKKQTKQLETLKSACKDYTCGSSNGNQQKCTEACKAYKTFIGNWKDQYKKQSKKYFNIKAIIPNKNIETNAYEYLHSELKDRCKNGDCKCMEQESETTSSNDTHGGTGGIVIEKHDDHIPASLDEEPEDVREQCKCASTTSPTAPHSGPGGGGSAGSGDPSNTRNGSQSGQDGKDSGKPSSGDPAGGKQNPQQPHSPAPSSPKGKKPDGEKGKGTKPDSAPEPKHIPEPKEPLNCIDEAAYYVGKEVENALNGVKNKLNGKIEHIDCTEENNNSPTKKTCDLKIPLLCEKYGHRKHRCGNKRENRFNVNTEWQCYRNLRLYGEKKGVCVPPRRENMCTKPLEYMRTGKYSTMDELFNVVLRTAAYEGKNLKEHWDKTEQEQKQTYGRTKIKKYELCDAMKYSFSDLGDIVRGTDMLLPSGRVPAVEKKLKEVFEKVKTQWEIENFQNKNTYPNLESFRSAWWDANRKHFWKAITCFAQDEFQLFKRLQGGSSTRLTQILYRCGHKYDPPVNDYIPQKFRWLTEWSENYCKAKKEKLEILKELCKKCASSGSSCEGDDIDGTKCEACKKKCKEYKIFVKLWQQQFETQSKIYNELYEKENKNSGSFNNVSATYGSKRNPLTLQDYDNKRTYNFIKKVKNKCGDDAKTAEQYLDKTTKCIPYKFNNSNNNDDNYAFKEQPPNEYENACDCKAPDPLDKCPSDYTTYNKVCTTLSTIQTCETKNFNNDLDNWNSYLVRESSGKNKGVLMPPRRRHLCTSVISSGIDRKNEYSKFMYKFLSAAYTEGLLLAKKYPDDNNEALQAIKYSFYDYGDIIKGTDLMDTTITTDIKTTLENLLKNPQNTAHSSSTSNEPQNVNYWWEHNKKKVWNAMLCGYRKSKNSTQNGAFDSSWCKVPDEDNIDQFLRWLIEWGEQACKEEKILKNHIDRRCNSLIYGSTQKFAWDLLKDHSCNNELKNYIGWIEMVKKSLEGFNIKFQMIKEASNVLLISEHSAEEYIKSKIHNNDCHFNDIKNTYDQITNSKDKDFQEILGKLFPKINFEEDTSKKNDNAQPSSSQKKDDTPHPLSPKQHDNGPIPSHPISPQSKDETNLTSNILSSTLPVGISFALGSIALLFYLKKKPILRPTKLFRVIDIPQNDYSMPNEKSSSKYIPYRSAQYKGKTYLYVEGEETDYHTHIHDISSSDITSSSESEYEEVNINDIYPYRSPKYKTLIEVVLKPSKTYDAENIHIDNNMEDNNDTPINKLTDVEWNQLKHDFISQYLEIIPKDLPNENTIDDNIYMDTQTNIIHNNMHEKPFITKIQDRKLYSDNDVVSYNINWNVPENINRTTNIIDNPKYGSSNDQYTGIDLINDSLNRDKHIDIYDELLKRKENELFGTKHKKNATTNSVVMEANSDPISNQIDLFNKWLDRHRNMCETWNNKKDILNKLNDEWNNENKEHIFGIRSNDNANDINRINDENYNIINTNNHEGNDTTSLEHLGSTNIHPNDLTTQNNGSETRNLRTNISMDIHFDENNNNNVLTTDVTHENDQLQNFYNS